ncbi:endonuclease domain-containing 1 protein-like [Conger conger]|uniref:endonuclease domain-containing 1 protein-like n=1 Tax=Conger conger TaxID=82655 RepID=UPI002A59A9CB|nr:endonuclease domain-containing 1 protein-like [Conger conger]
MTWSRAWALLLAGVAVEVARASVESEFSADCRPFLYMGTPPLGLEARSLRRICQRYGGQPRYLTLYDTADHVPIYSAYTFKRSDGGKQADIPWMYEPQLATLSDGREMQPFPHGYLHHNFEDSQAVLEDYDNAFKYERGQLNPDEHQADPSDKAATYTLTNVVPQVREFKIGPWTKQNHVIRRRLNNYCRGTAYVVTGITTAGHMIRHHNIDRVAVPAYMWSAYCCIRYDRNAPFEERYKFPAYAYYGLNDKENNQVLEISIKKLEEFLKGSTFVDKNFQIFVDDCVPPPSALP